jgi:hypothetical protein
MEPESNQAFCLSTIEIYTRLSTCDPNDTPSHQFATRVLVKIPLKISFAGNLAGRIYTTNKSEFEHAFQRVGTPILSTHWFCPDTKGDVWLQRHDVGRRSPLIRVRPCTDLDSYFVELVDGRPRLQCGNVSIDLSCTDLLCCLVV